jgi:pimeloyl-ACP methyl ester carboxylesterase
VQVASTPYGPIEYQLTGSGPVVMVLKGGHCSRSTHLGHERLADEGFAVLEASRPGYDSTPPTVGPTARGAADALVSLLDALEISSVSLVAISAAGHTGIELARRHPDRVDRVSFESAMSLPFDPMLRRAGRVMFGRLQSLVWRGTRLGLRAAPDLTLRLELSQVSSLDAARLVREMDPTVRQQYLEIYRSLWSGRGFVLDLQHVSPGDDPIEQPALIIRSTNDPSVPAQHAARLAALCSSHELVDVDAESHFVWFGRAADEVWRRRLAFLRAEPGTSPTRSAG